MIDLNNLPSVDRLLQPAEAQALASQYERDMSVQALREVLLRVSERSRWNPKESSD